MKSALLWALRLVAGGLIVLGTFVAAACGESAESRDAASADALSPSVSLEPTFDSPEALAAAILAGLAEEDGERLESYVLSEAQFRDHVWPQLPSSRPERGVPFDYAWGDLHQKSHNALLRTFANYQGKALELLELRFEDGVTDYGSYVVHRDARVKVRGVDGQERWLDLFGSVMEKDGRFKLFSYVTD